MKVTVNFENAKGKVKPVHGVGQPPFVGCNFKYFSYLTEAGIPCVDSIGIDGKNIHSADECARIDSLKESAKRLATVAYCI